MGSSSLAFPSPSPSPDVSSSPNRAPPLQWTHGQPTLCHPSARGLKTLMLPKSSTAVQNELSDAHICQANEHAWSRLKGQYRVARKLVAQAYAQCACAWVAL